MSISVSDNRPLDAVNHCEITRICKLAGKGSGLVRVVESCQGLWQYSFSRIAPTLTESNRESLYLTRFKGLILFEYYVDSDSR
jgi:hypothetical protein